MVLPVLYTSMLHTLIHFRVLPGRVGYIRKVPVDATLDLPSKKIP